MASIFLCLHLPPPSTARFLPTGEILATCLRDDENNGFVWDFPESEFQCSEQVRGGMQL